MRLRDIRATTRAVPDLIDSATVAGDEVAAAAIALQSALRTAVVALVLLSTLTMLVCTYTLKAVQDAR